MHLQSQWFWKDNHCRTKQKLSRGISVSHVVFRVSLRVWIDTKSHFVHTYYDLSRDGAGCVWRIDDFIIFVKIRWFAVVMMVAFCEGHFLTDRWCASHYTVIPDRKILIRAKKTRQSWQLRTDMRHASLVAGTFVAFLSESRLDRLAVSVSKTQNMSTCLRTCRLMFSNYSSMVGLSLPWHVSNMQNTRSYTHLPILAAATAIIEGYNDSQDDLSISSKPNALIL